MSGHPTEPQHRKAVDPPPGAAGPPAPPPPPVKIPPPTVAEAKRALLAHGDRVDREWAEQFERAKASLKQEVKQRAGWAALAALGAGLFVGRRATRGVGGGSLSGLWNMVRGRHDDESDRSARARRERRRRERDRERDEEKPPARFGSLAWLVSAALPIVTNVARRQAMAFMQRRWARQAARRRGEQGRWAGEEG